MCDFNDKVPRISLPPKTLELIKALNEDGCKIIMTHNAVLWFDTEEEAEEPLDITEVVMRPGWDNDTLLDFLLEDIEDMKCPECLQYSEGPIITIDEENCRTKYYGPTKACEDCMENYRESQIDDYERYGLKRSDF